jgi:NAD(P)-dependent dehydrogenase (short-subunit alcohol dehydrogenase family)
MSPPLMVRPELLALDLRGKIFIVTGANSGLGLATTRQLAKQGGTVVMGCRRVAEGERVADTLRAELPHARLEVLPLDLGDLDSVRAFARAFMRHHEQLHGLVNNAGVMDTPAGHTKDGFETQLGTNHLGHFLLTELLVDVLKASAPSRIVILSSFFHEEAFGRKGAIHFKDPNYHHRKFDGWEAYAQSKLANLLHARTLGRRLRGTGVTVASVNPGFVHTNLLKIPVPKWLETWVAIPVLRLTGMIEPWEGVQTTLHTLLAPEVIEQSGQYFSQKSRYKAKAARAGGWPLHSPNPLAHDDATADRLWKLSAELVNSDSRS